MDGRLKKIAQSAAMFGGTVVAAGMAIKGVSDYFTNPEGGSQTLRGMMEATSVFHGQQGQQLRTGGGGALIPVPPPATLSGFGRDELEAEKRELKARARRALDRDDHAAHGAAGAHLALLQQLLDAMAELPELVHRGVVTEQRRRPDRRAVHAPQRRTRGDQPLRFVAADACAVSASAVLSATTLSSFDLCFGILLFGFSRKITGN